MNRSRRSFLAVAVGLVLTAGCSGVQRRPAERISRPAGQAAVSNKAVTLGRVSEGGVEVVGPEVSSRVDPEPPIE